MTTNGLTSNGRLIGAATLLFAAGAALAADVTGTLINNDNKSFQGVIKWRVASKAYVVTTSAGGRAIELEVPPAQVKELAINEPAGFKEALKAVQEGRAQQAIPVLERISQDYVMLQWDEPATRGLAEAYLADGKKAEALRACEKVIAVKPEAAYTGAMAPLYWQALLKSDRGAKLEDLLEQAIKNGAQEDVASALTMRGDILAAKADFKGALKDGYLRVVTLFRAVKAAQPEALFKAAKAFDQLNQPQRAEMMRKQLLTEYAASEWARQVKGGS